MIYDSKVRINCLVLTAWTFQHEGVLSLPASFRLSVRKLYLVCSITRHRFDLESSNLHQTCILGYSRLVSKMEVSDLDLPFWLRILGNLACLFDNLYWIWGRIIKFTPNMHLGILSARIENGGHLTWPSSSLGHHFDSRNCIRCCLCTDLGRPRALHFSKVHLFTWFLKIVLTSNFRAEWQSALQVDSTAYMYYLHLISTIIYWWLTCGSTRIHSYFPDVVT